MYLTIKIFENLDYFLNVWTGGRGFEIVHLGSTNYLWWCCPKIADALTKCTDQKSNWILGAMLNKSIQHILADFRNLVSLNERKRLELVVHPVWCRLFVLFGWLPTVSFCCRANFICRIFPRLTTTATPKPTWWVSRTTTIPRDRHLILALL